MKTTDEKKDLRALEKKMKGGEEQLAALDPSFRSALLSMYRDEPQPGADGQLHSIDRETRISAPHGMWMYDLCLSAKPKATLEVGMAYGYSTLYILAALARNRAGHHTAIDPFQHALWHGIGLTHARTHAPAGGNNGGFRFIEDRSDRVAADLARANAAFDLIYIDGNHRFDDVLTDFYLYAPLCATGGHIVFDDVWMPSIRTVMSFVRANRNDFAEIATPVSSICVFQRIGDDTRKWNHFQKFTDKRRFSWKKMIPRALR